MATESRGTVPGGKESQNHHQELAKKFWSMDEMRPYMEGKSETPPLGLPRYTDMSIRRWKKEKGGRRTEAMN